MRDSKKSPRLGQRILLWFGSVVLSIVCFSLVIGLPAGLSFVVTVAGITSLFALPVAFLYLPIVIHVKDADHPRVWTILLVGTFIGPAALLLRGIIQTLAGENWQMIWRGDVAGGLAVTMIYALVVGFLASGFYVFGLRRLTYRNNNVVGG